MAADSAAEDVGVAAQPARGCGRVGGAVSSIVTEHGSADAVHHAHSRNLRDIARGKETSRSRGNQGGRAALHVRPSIRDRVHTASLLLVFNFNSLRVQEI